MTRQRRGRATLLQGTALQAVTVLFFSTHASAQPAPNARPTGGQVVAGSANIGQSAAQTTVNQSSQRAAINWQSFDVGSQQTVQFNQPGASAVTLNRVTGPDPSQIAGRIVANGNIIITNPSGVAFSRGAQVDVNGLIVSAPGISTQNFMAGRLVFDQAPNPGASVSNAGTITVKQAGLAALVAPQVANSGVINARLGHVVLAGAEAHTIDLYGDGLVSIDVTKAVTQAPSGATALVTNTGTVIADGGSVQITARAADGIVQDLVRAGGTIRANTVGNRTGRIEITGVGGSVRVEGRVAADGGAGAGGTIAVRTSDTVTVANGAVITANGRGGGGTVALGTTIARARAGRQAALSHGASPGTPVGTARRVVVESGAVVSADGSGSGGTVTTLSTQSTEIGGLLTTRGGGVIEASSAGVLVLTQAPNAGKGGTLYLDPYDLIIGTGTPTATLSGSATNPGIPLDGATSGTSYIAPATLQQAAQNGAVTISLNATHDLTVQESVNLTTGQTSSGAATGGASLYLHADHDLIVLADITIGASGSGKSLTLDAGHAIFIGPASGPAVTLAVDGNITMTTTSSFASDPLGSSITVYDNSVITSNSAISLEASNRIQIGSNVQMSAGSGGAFAYNPDEATYTGILLQAGGDITIANNTTLSTNGTSDDTPAIILDAGGSALIGSNTSLTTSGSFADLYLYAGSSTESLQNANAPSPNAAGSVSVGGSTILSGASLIDISSGTGGQTTLAAGSNLQSSQFGYVRVASGTGGTTLDGTIQSDSVRLNSDGSVQQSPGAVIIASDLTGNASSFSLLGASNQITQIGAYQGETLAATSGDVTVTDGIGLTVGGVGSVGGGIQVTSGRSITLVTDSLTIGPGEQDSRFSQNTISATLFAPGGTVAIENLTPGRPVELVSGEQTPNTLSVTSGELSNVVADRLQLGSTTAGALTLGSGMALDFTTGPVQQLDLASGAAIVQGQDDSLTVGTLTLQAASASLIGSNAVDTLGAFAVSGALVMRNTTDLVVAGAGTAASLTLGVAGSVQFAGNLNIAGDLIVTASGAILQTGGTLSAGTLSGSAVGSAQFGGDGVTDIGNLAGFSVTMGPTTPVFGRVTAPLQSATTLFSLDNAGPLTVIGPVSANTITLRSVGSMTLQAAQFASDDAALEVESAADGAATLIQTGTATFAPLDGAGATVLLQLDGVGAMSFEALSAPDVSLTLGLGAGSATGTIDAAALSVVGQNGSTTLTGTVAGQGGAQAAALSTLSSGTNAAYTLNGCLIGGGGCGAPQPPVSPPSPSPVLAPAPVAAAPVIRLTITGDASVALFEPKSVETILGRSRKAYLLQTDPITIGVIRNPSAPDLLLPNISNRDY